MAPSLCGLRFPSRPDPPAASCRGCTQGLAEGRKRNNFSLCFWEGGRGGESAKTAARDVFAPWWRWRRQSRQHVLSRPGAAQVLLKGLCYALEAVTSMHLRQNSAWEICLWGETIPELNYACAVAMSRASPLRWDGYCWLSVFAMVLQLPFQAPICWSGRFQLPCVEGSPAPCFCFCV